FVLTTTDSMSLTISMAISGDGNPPRWLRAFFAVLMGAVAVVLVTLGEGSVNALQSFIVVTAVPVLFLLLTTFYTAPTVAKQLYKVQFGEYIKQKQSFYYKGCFFISISYLFRYGYIAFL